uniref:Carbohydrate sulfotransferase n=1 Tax=Oryzias latipes TaxID=8090 RepID=A0A3B3HMT5_ORYLA
MPIPEALEIAKQRHLALSSRLKRYTRDNEARWINRLFATQPAKVYAQWQGQNSQADPPRLETEQYWKRILEKETAHNSNAQWLVSLRKEHSIPPRTESSDHHSGRYPRKSLRYEELDNSHMIHVYWLKKLTALHERLAAQMNQLLKEVTHPEWLTEGRTILIQKDPSKGAVPSNYRPITCFSTTWKLMPGIIATKINRHMDQYMSNTQKGIGRDSRGAKHQLLIDRTVVACTNWKRTLIALRQNEPYPDPIKVRLCINNKNYTKFLFVRDPFVRLISAYRDKMQHYDQYFYEGYIRVILQRYKNQKDVPVKYNGTKKTYLKPSFHNFVQYIVDPRSEKYAPFEPHWRQMHRLCHPCLVEYDFVGHQESLQEDAQQLLKILKLENAITFPPSYENIKAIRKDVSKLTEAQRGTMRKQTHQGVSIEDRRKLYKIYEKDFQLFDLYYI